MPETPKVGSVVHVEFAVKDPNKVKKFYGELFGWQFTDMPEVNYTLFEAPSGPGGGMIRVIERQGPGITNYLYVTNIGETVKKIEPAGGRSRGRLDRLVPGPRWDPDGALAATAAVATGLPWRGAPCVSRRREP